MTTHSTARAKLLKEVKLILGGGMVTVELTPDHYNLAFDLALDRYRQRSGNSLSDRVIFLDLQPEQSEYILPKEVKLVRQLYRRGTSGTSAGAGVNFDPFGAAFVNQTTIGMGSGQSSLLTYELYAGLQETIGRMFGLFINYTWEPHRNRLTINRHIKAKETILIEAEVIKTEEELLDDMYAKPWLRDYTVAKCKIMLGEARSKFASIVGPQGGTTLNGDSLKAEGEAELLRLEDEVARQIDDDEGYGFVIG